MPFIVTEPQRIEGTKLGFSVYPYHFSFEDHFEKRDYNQKLVIFKLKDGEFIETDGKIFESKFADHVVSRRYVENTVKNFVVNNPQYVTDPQKVVDYFGENKVVQNCREEVKKI